MSEPEYYKGNGLSPIGAFKQGLISRDELIGFYKGNIIKYVVRAGHKNDAVEDLRKAKSYIDFYLELLDSSSDISVDISVDVGSFDDVKYEDDTDERECSCGKLKDSVAMTMKQVMPKVGGQYD